MKTRILGLVAFGLLATLATEVKANFILNGDFSNPNVPASAFVTTFNVGSTGISSWTVISGTTNPGQGTVDLLASSFVAAPNGGQTVDLDGFSAGGISQTVTGLTVGTSYGLTFYYTNNFYGASASALVSVVNSNATPGIDGSLSISHSGATMAAPGFVATTLYFTASTSIETVTFQSTDPATDASGIFISNVSLNTVPEPSSIAMVGMAGMIGVGAFVRRKRSIA